MKVFTPQLRAAYAFLAQLKDEEDVKDVRFLQNIETMPLDLPTLQVNSTRDLLIVQVSYRETGKEAAPLLKELVMAFGPKGAYSKLNSLMQGSVYFGFMGSCVPLDVSTIQVI
jgi:hypothetical protein